MKIIFIIYCHIICPFYVLTFALTVKPVVPHSVTPTQSEALMSRGICYDSVCEPLRHSVQMRILALNRKPHLLPPWLCVSHPPAQLEVDVYSLYELLCLLLLLKVYTYAYVVHICIYNLLSLFRFVSIFMDDQLKLDHLCGSSSLEGTGVSPVIYY